MAVDKITFADKVSMIESTLPVINRIRDVDVNEIKDVVNNNADELEAAQENITNITTGTGTMDTTYTGATENNHWEKVGKIVSFEFTTTVKGTWTTTTQFISGLPKPATNIRFSGINSSADRVLRCEIRTDGTIRNAYSTTTPTANQILEGHITYITSE